MKLSELLKTENPEKMVTGVIADCECLSAPTGVDVVGFIFEPGASGLSENLMDAIITFNLSGIYVILEIPHDADVDAGYLMKLASNAGFSISLLPAAKEADVNAWGEQCAKFVDAFLTTPNFSRHLYPVQGYFTYLITEKLGDVDALTPTDEYVVSRFTSVTPEAWSDKSKEHMRAAFSEACGGEDGIYELASDLVSAIGHEAGRILEDDARTNPNA
jgi:hypothetical protein